MTNVQLAFGQRGLDLPLDETRFAPTVLTPRDAPPLPDPHDAFLDVVRRPRGTVALGDLVATKARQLGRSPQTVAIVIADHTRPVPDHLLVPWIVAELGLPDAAITVLVGTGTHRGSTAGELDRMLGAQTRHRFTVRNHDCQDQASLVRVGMSSCGGTCWLNRDYVQADLRITTGFIEPHFFAGFSGGTKGIVPAIAGLETVRHFHRARLIAHPRSTWGDVTRNPLQALTREMVALCPPDFCVNVTLNLQKAITGVFAGEVVAVHDAGCVRAAEEALIPVERRFPVVVTTNSGYPLDQNFYQTVKGISAAARIVEPGGTILVASECRAGLPGEGDFRSILADPRPSDELLTSILDSTHTRHDQWQVQTLLQCLQKSRIILHSSLPDADRPFTRTEHSENLELSLAEMGGHQLERLPVAIMPMGPLTIPVLADPS